MKRLLIAGAVVAVALAGGIAIALAATGGGSDSSTPNPAPAPKSAAATVSGRQIGDTGNVLVDSTGHALYANDQESRGMVLCDGACLSFWTPLTVKGHAQKGNGLSGTLGVVKRPDGAKQVTYNGKLLYTFYMDKAGEVGGDGFDDAFGGQQFTWHVVHADNTSSSSNSRQTGRGYPGY